MSGERSAGGRPLDEVWKHVEKLGNGKWKCKYCDRVSKGSASRIRNHLSGKGNDISACASVSKKVQEEVLRQKPPKKRQLEENNNNNDNVRGQDMVWNTSSRAVASDSIQQVSSSFYSNVDVAVGMQGMSNCMPDGVVAWNEPATERRDTNNNDALATVGMASAPLQFQDPSPSSYSDPVLFTKTATEESVTNAFLKFLMCNQFSSVGPDILKHPSFREFMERAQKHGVPSSLLRGGSLVIEKSLLNIKQEVHQYMLMVKESWNITGSTMMAFHLNHQYKGKVFTLGQDRYVYGFYCPKGFIFVEAPYCSNIDFTAFYNAFEKALEQHSPGFTFYDIDRHTIFLDHSINHGLGDDHLCELSDKVRPGWVISLPCLRHEIQGLCINTCKSSGWAQSLINKAVQIHECLFRRGSKLYQWYHELIMEKDEDFKYIECINGKDASRLSNFLSNFISFMLLERKLKEKLSYEMQFREDCKWDRAELEAILKDSKFWGDGRHLLQVLTLTLRIPDIMDTLVPTAGYLAHAIDKVNDMLTGRYGTTIPEGVEAFTFWKDLESKLRGTIKGRRATASYLNPFYLRGQDVMKQTQLQNKVKLELTKLWGEEEKLLHQELQKYGNVSLNHCEFIHPVKWWEKYGNDLPLLREHAIWHLSQPLNCMCNQVKKHMYQLQGADDFILRLNVRMMEEFKLLGDDIYEPIDLDELELDYWLID